jgi:predicted nucleic acid-binding protein
VTAATGAPVTDVLRGVEAVRELLDTLDESGPPRVSAISVMGLWERIHLSDSTAAERIVLADVQIAATARVHDLPVVADNADHFERVDGVRPVDC